MKYSFEARMEAYDNRRKIIDNNVNGAIEELEAYILTAQQRRDALNFRLMRANFQRILTLRSKKRSLTIFLRTVIKLTGVIILLK